MNLPLNIDFTGKVVVITGAGGALCGTMARAFAQAGAKVAALNRSAESIRKLEEDCQAKGQICRAWQVNVLDREALKKVHEQVKEELGPCDILINGAGGNNPKATTDNEYQEEAKEGQKTFFDLEEEGVDAVFRLNFQGTLLPTQVFAKDMVQKKTWLYTEYFFHERLYAVDEDSRIFCSEIRDLQFYAVAGRPFCRNRHPLQCHSAGISGIRPEPCAAVSGRRNFDRAFPEDSERDSHEPFCGKRGAFRRRLLPVRRPGSQRRHRRHTAHRRRLLRLLRRLNAVQTKTEQRCSERGRRRRKASSFSLFTPFARCFS